MKTFFIVACFLALAFIAGTFSNQSTRSVVADESQQQTSGELAKAMFAGGCFWCMEKPFEHLDGVVSVISGYSGGKSKKPTYEDYMADGHIEVVEITYDPKKIGYQQLLDVYWRQVDPTDAAGQFVDRGHAYSTAIFYNTDEERRLAEASKEELAASGIFKSPLVTPILPYSTFYQAEEYHQDYYKKIPSATAIIEVARAGILFSKVLTGVKIPWKNRATKKI